MLIRSRLDYFLDAAIRLYSAANHNPLQETLPALPHCLEPSLRCIYGGAHIPFPTFISDSSIPPPDPNKVDRNLFVLGSTGGKDGLAVALLLLKEGMRGIAVHIRGINPAYPHEAAAARRQATALKMDYREIQVKVNKNYLENPARNHAILLILTSVAHKMGASVVVEGLHDARIGATQPFESGWSDCREMALAGKEMLGKCAPWIYNRIGGFPLSDTESIEYVAVNAPHLIPMVQSCMTTARLHGMIRAKSCSIAGYELMPGRCGACYKCCREWLVLRGLDMNKASSAYEEFVKQRLVQSAQFCFGPVSSSWTEEEILAQFLYKPSKL